MLFGPMLAAALSGAAIFCLFRVLQESDRVTAETLKKHRVVSVF